MKRITTATALYLALFTVFWGGCFSASWGASDSGPQVESKQLLDKLAASGVTHATNARTNKLRFLAGAGGAPIPHEGAPAAPSLAALGTEGAARTFLESYGPLFGIGKQSEELAVKRITTPDEHRSFVKFRQVCAGLPVFASELVVQLDSRKRAVSVNGSVSPDCALDATATVRADEARVAGIDFTAENYDIDPAALAVKEVTLSVYNPALLGRGENKGLLVWQMEVTAGARAPIQEFVLIDAKTGAVVLHFNRIFDARNRAIYDKNNYYGSQTIPGTEAELKRSERDESDSGIEDVDDAYHYAGDTYDFYQSIHGRDSLDNMGMPLVNTVRYCPDPDDCPYRNAFWTPEYQQMVYGQGFTADDVVGHELTHGVTEYESGLIYLDESGAINESLSDLWGEFIDQWNLKGTDTEAVKWLMAEDIPGGAIRNMKDPTLFMDPDRMTSPNFYCGGYDNGGVHWNSGVNNKAAYLMAEGGAFNGITVTALGIEKVAKIYYEAQTNILTSNTGYADLYDDLQLACSNLIGTAVTTTADCTQVKNALDAVEMSEPSSCTAAQPNLTPYQYDGWSGPLVVSRTINTNTDSTLLTAADTLYVDWFVANLGNAETLTTFNTSLYVDGAEVASWYSAPPVGAYEGGYVLDYPIGKLSAGAHTISITTDVTGVIAESDETDNSYRKTITILPATYGMSDMSGTVRSGSTTGVVLAGAVVSIAGKTATTSSTGTFSITAIPAGSYTLTISKSGYQTYTKSGYVVIGNQSGLTFPLMPLCSMSGTVRSGSTTGVVLAGAVVSLAGKTATTSSTGTFSVTAVPAGSYTLTVSKSGYQTYTKTGYVVSGNQSGLTFPLLPLCTMSGTVRYTTGAALAGAVVSIAGKTATTSSYGTFSISAIPAGSYTLTISKSGYQSYTKAGYVISGNQSGLTFSLIPLYGMSGTVRSGSTTGPVVAGATVTIAGKSVTTSSTGTFSLTAIPAATYTVTVAKSGYKTYTACYVMNGNKSGVTFVLTPLYSMSGTVRAGSATGPVLAGATVSIAGKTAITSGTGTFSITAIPLGTYSLSISKYGYRTYLNSAYPVRSNLTGLSFALTK